MAQAWPTVCSTCQQVGCTCVKPVNSQPQRRTRRMYNRRWQRTRRQFMKDNPLCISCNARGIVRPAEEVDHVTPHKGDQGLFWDTANWQALCKRCHSRKTQREADTGKRVVVCGQPTTGKSTFVQKHLTAGDIVFDYAAILAAVLPGHTDNRTNPIELIGLIEGMREAAVVYANTSATKRNLWMIVANRRRADVLAARMGAQLVDLDGPTCQPPPGPDI